MPSARARPCEEAAIQSIRVVRDCAASAKPWVLLATILASSIAYLDEFIVNVALPAIETDLAASVSVIQWLINAYTLMSSSGTISAMCSPCHPASSAWLIALVASSCSHIGPLNNHPHVPV